MEDSEFNDSYYSNAKSYLLTCSTDTGANLYDHLSQLLTKILIGTPADPLATLEDDSRDAKKCRVTSDPQQLRDQWHFDHKWNLASKQINLFQKHDHKPSTPESEDEDILPNLMRIAHYFELSGEGIQREEMFRIWLAMNQLLSSDLYPIENIRLWGKVLGTRRNYIVLEAELSETEDEETNFEQTSTPLNSPVNGQGGPQDTESDIDSDVIPTTIYRPPPVIPAEQSGTGVNKKTYFVCNEPGEEWIRLPDVTPAQIVCARQIKKFLSGDVNALVISNPPFPGHEINYLRAQIARISASTVISPQGVYKFDEEAEGEEEEGRDSYVPDPDFEGLTMAELADPEIRYWVHHVPYILPQGRTKWFNPVHLKHQEEMDDGEEEDEEREEADEPEPEVGPPLLTPILEDEDIDGAPPWVAHYSTKLVPEYAVAILHSSLWPGAHAFAVEQGKYFENIYIGWGMKYTATHLEPVLPPLPQLEFPSGPETTEDEDPTPEVEAAWRKRQQEWARKMEEEAEAAEEEESDEDDY
ncbi:radial spoke head protein 4 homolog A [Lingula anatina]|uniref:Radial spoke head protein 4 homolog A n=1 Tax=Lingula anatina TaxID=7574 RepID=A0A1S3I1H4_LINAN|nr:radial spoke head protein 4 homolog A [Lingula anatina]XP_013391200.1 radial spoke head protein 4 homolog A [Lingula anatina]|eukprot:XP_013391199.1 radial spoke head protein 4 homolog A [Lingula anatina]